MVLVKGLYHLDKPQRVGSGHNDGLLVLPAAGPYRKYTQWQGSKTGSRLRGFVIYKKIKNWSLIIGHIEDRSYLSINIDILFIIFRVKICYFFFSLRIEFLCKCWDSARCLKMLQMSRLNLLFRTVSMQEQKIW